MVLALYYLFGGKVKIGFFYFLQNSTDVTDLLGCISFIGFLLKKGKFGQFSLNAAPHYKKSNTNDHEEFFKKCLLKPKHREICTQS